MQGKRIAVDLDETLSTGKFWEGEPKVIEEMKDKVWEWYKAGATILIYTARQPRYYAETLAWLLKHDVPFHGICLPIKPSADYYVEDRAVDLHILSFDDKVAVYEKQKTPYRGNKKENKNVSHKEKK